MNKFILLFVLSFTVEACPEISKDLIPTTALETIELCRENYMVAYSKKEKSAVWVGENLFKEEIEVDEERDNAFKADPDLGKGERSELIDYTLSDYDRGHLAPAGDASSDLGMVQSFYLSNMVPQNKNNNRGIWRSLEKRVREYVINNDQAIVFTGPIYEDNPKVIGHNKIMVPEMLFKVIYNPKTKQSFSFIIPNKKIKVEKLPEFLTSIDRVKKKSKIDFSNLHSIDMTRPWWSI